MNPRRKQDALWVFVWAKVRVVADEVCAPELRERQLQQIADRTMRGGGLSGWVKQQVGSIYDLMLIAHDRYNPLDTVSQCPL